MSMAARWSQTLSWRLRRSDFCRSLAPTAVRWPTHTRDTPPRWGTAHPAARRMGWGGDLHGQPARRRSTPCDADALAHKGLNFEVRAVRFADVRTIRALSGQHLTPVLSHGDHVVHETWDIACYLEEQFPDRPSLFGGAIGRSMARHINARSDSQLASPLRLVIY